MYSLSFSDIAKQRGRTIAAPSSTASITGQSQARRSRVSVALTVASVDAVLKVDLTGRFDDLEKRVASDAAKWNDSPSCHCRAAQLAILLFAPNRVALVMLLLAACHAQLNLGAAVFEINRQWNQCCAS